MIWGNRSKSSSSSTSPVYMYWMSILKALGVMLVTVITPDLTSDISHVSIALNTSDRKTRTALWACKISFPHWILMSHMPVSPRSWAMLNAEDFRSAGWLLGLSLRIGLTGWEPSPEDSGRRRWWDQCEREWNRLHGALLHESLPR